MRDPRRPRPSRPQRAVRAAVAAFVLFDVVVALIVWQFFAESRTANAQAASWAAASRHVATRSAPIDVQPSAAATVLRLGGGLDAVVVYDILPARSSGAAWLGTGLGLVRVAADGTAAAHRIFPDAPREWVRDLAWTPRGIAVSITLASGNTGGETLGTFLFDPKRESFESIGPYARELASDGTTLYGVEGHSLVRYTLEAERTTPVAPDVKICREVDLVHAAGALWMTQQGQVRTGSYSAREVPCGVSRVRPGQANAVTWMEEDGLASGFGRSIVGDERTVYVSHGIQGDGLSVLDQASGRWGRLRGGSGIRFNANLLGLSSRSLWLGTPDGSRPLVRIDRASGEAFTIEEAPENHYVSAIAGDAEGAWVAWSAKHYEGDTYRVETWVAHLRDSETRTAGH